uniref:Uncharacterized protein n=1 Tax=Rhipicephalus zambeziensis TaxID=60191 RepID=A0A224YGL3_9ACAR
MFVLLAAMALLGKEKKKKSINGQHKIFTRLMFICLGRRSVTGLPVTLQSANFCEQFFFCQTCSHNHTTTENKTACTSNFFGRQSLNLNC